MESKNSRFSTLRVFKLNSKPPPPPPKDAPGPYNITPYTTSPSSASASTSQLTLSSTFDNMSTMPAADDNDARFLSPHSANPFKKGFSKLSNLGKGPKRSLTTDAVPSSSSSDNGDDQGISGPWNFQHHLHVNGDLHGLPPSWSATLSDAGFSDNQIAALRARRPVPAASAFTPTVITPKPRGDSLRRPTASTSASAALNFVRRPPSPALSSPGGTGSHTTPSTGGASPTTTSTTPVSLHTPSSPSTRAPPPAPLTFRIVNRDPPEVDTAMLVSPPPAYAGPSSPVRRALGGRRMSMEKMPLEGEDEGASRDEWEDVPQEDAMRDEQDAMQNEPEDAREQYALDERVALYKQEALSEQDSPQDASHEQDSPLDAPQDQDRERSPSPPLPTPVPALPPRLSLHTDKDDDWADMFSFLPSSVNLKRSSLAKTAVLGRAGRESLTLGRRESLTLGRRESLTLGRRESLTVGRRESMTLGRRESVTLGRRESMTRESAGGQAKRRSRRIPVLALAASSSSPTSPSHANIDSPSDQGTTMIYTHTSGVFTPDARYPIANSPLWEEVRTLVRTGAGSEQAPPPPAAERTSLVPPPVLSSRFSDASSVGVTSRFSSSTTAGADVSRFSTDPPSRFSTDTHAPVSRFSDATSFFIRDSTTSSRFPTQYFSPLDTMPESPLPVGPVVGPSGPTPVPPTHARTLPPPRPPPKNGLPPPPPLHASTLPPPSRPTPAPPSPSRTTPAPPPPSRPAPSPPTPTPPSSRPTSPPPLPLPPGKVLPSLIRERRRQEQQERRRRSQDSASSSASVVSLDLAVQIAYQERGGRLAHEEPTKSPMLAYLDAGEDRSEEEEGDDDDDDDEEDTVPLATLRRRATDDPDLDDTVRQPAEHSHDDDDTVPLAQLRKDSRADEDDEDDTRGIPPPPEDTPHEPLFEPSILESPSIYDHASVPPTPSVYDRMPGSDSDSESEYTHASHVAPLITVNGATPSPRSPHHPEVLPLVLAPLREYIYLEFDPLTMFLHLQEVAQGQYGSVYVAQLADSADALVAVKKVPIPADGTPKIAQLQHELALMSQVRHKHILAAADALFYEAGAGMLWIRMELMERSLADVLGLCEEGLVLNERVIARFASDALLALVYLHDLGLAHRDVRSDNILINSEGVLKLADFSNAVHFSPQDPFRIDIVGVHHWQAPEIRKGRYDASLVDVWSLGATCWEMAESVPPFADIEDTRALGDRWPPLSRRAAFSPAFHEFLRMCSDPPGCRPAASQLLRHRLIQQACPRDVVLQIMDKCRQIEEDLQHDGEEREGDV